MGFRSPTKIYWKHSLGIDLPPTEVVLIKTGYPIATALVSKGPTLIGFYNRAYNKREIDLFLFDPDTKRWIKQITMGK